MIVAISFLFLLCSPFILTSLHAKFQRIQTTIHKLYVHTSACAVLPTGERFVLLIQVSTEHATNPFQKKKNTWLF